MGAYHEYILTSLLVILAILLDLVVNKRVKGNDVVLCVIEIPREILLLSMGFIFTYTASEHANSNEGTIWIVISLIVALLIYSICSYCSERYLRLGNRSSKSSFSKYAILICIIILAWLISALFYYFAVSLCFGGGAT